MLYFIYKIGRFVALNLPVKISYQIANILGSLYYLVAKKDRRIVTGNIKIVLNRSGNNAVKASHASRMIFVNFARYLVEFFRTPKIDSKYIKENVRIEGKENLDAALSLKRGVLLLSANLGNWELGAMVLSMLGYKINVVAWIHKNRLINDFFLKMRQSKGVKVIPLGVGVRKVFSALKNNQAVALLGDVDYLNPKEGITVKLFGQDTIIPKGPALFSLRTACPIIPLFVLREKNNKFNFVLEKPIIYKPSEDQEYDLTKLTQKITKSMEFYIARYPSQWFMLTPRWHSA